MTITSIQPQKLSTLTTSDKHVWERWMYLWYGLFYASLILATSLALIQGDHSWQQNIAILALSLLLGMWYGVCVVASPNYWYKHPLLTVGYLVAGWLLWFILTGLDPVYLFVLVGLYPQVYTITTLLWKVPGALLLTALCLWRQFELGGILNGGFLITLIATPIGILMALFIHTIVGQSQKRQRLIDALEATRQALTVAERQAGIMEERQRLAREIHDTLAQGFTSIVMHLEAADISFPDDLSTLQLHIDLARRTARENLVEARRLLWALQPAVLDRASLVEVLTALTKRWSEESGLPASATITGTPQALRPEIEVTLLRAAQEALANARKHSQASQLSLTLSYIDETVALDVQDDGVGFDLSHLCISPVEQHAGGFGLKALRERVEQIGGTLSMESAPGEGTTIAVALPALSKPSSLPIELSNELSNQTVTVYGRDLSRPGAETHQ